jgi:hypothetical protein
MVTRARRRRNEADGGDPGAPVQELACGRVAVDAVDAAELDDDTATHAPAGEVGLV